MSTPPTTAPRHLTSWVLRIGVLVAAACFLVAGAGELAGNQSGSGDMTDVGALIDGAFAFTPWAWASLGVFALVLTPAVGLLLTAYEYRSVSDRRTALLALAVLAVLVVSAVIATLR